MIILGFRREDAHDLASYLLRQGKNEEIIIQEIGSYPANSLNKDNFHAALRLMDTQAKAKGKHRTLYHAIIALNDTESLSPTQLPLAIDILAAHFGLTGHQRAVVEHKKNGKSHFHVVFNLINPLTGKLIRVQWTHIARRNAANELAEKFGFAHHLSNAWPIRRWEYNRGKRSGIDPLKMRTEITALYHKSKTGEEFVAHLARACYILSKGRHNNYVLVDKAKDIHGLIRRLEGVRLAEFEQKFPDLKNLQLTPLTLIPGIKKRVRHSTLNKNVVAFRRYTLKLLNRHKTQSPLANRSSVSPSQIRIGSLSPPQGLSTMLLAHSRSAQTYQNREPQYPTMWFSEASQSSDENVPDMEKCPLRHAEMDSEELLAWAFANKRFDILAEFGIHPASEINQP